MRVLMVTQVVDLDHPVLGFTHAWVNALAQHVEELHVVTLVAGRHDLAGNVVLHAYGPPKASHSRLTRFRFYNKWFAELILGGQIDVIFVHMIPRWVIMAAPYGRMRNIPITLWYAHGHVPGMLRIAERFVCRIVTSTPEGCTLPSSKVIVLGQGIDTDHFSPAFRQLDGTFRILSVGRLSPIKHHEMLMEAMRILVHERGMDNVRARIVGGPAHPSDHEYAAKLRQRMIDCDVKGQITFVGPLSYDEVVTEYQNCDLFVNFSQTGSLDKAVLEAMGCGVPVVTSNPAFKALLSDLGGGWMIPHGDAQALVNTIVEVSEMRSEERRQIGLALREMVQADHSLDRLMRRLVAVLGDQEVQQGSHRDRVVNEIRARADHLESKPTEG